MIGYWVLVIGYSPFPPLLHPSPPGEGGRAAAG